MKNVLLLLLFIFASCATTRQTDQLLKKREYNSSNPPELMLSKVPLVKQSDFHCGPAAMAMALKYKGKHVSMEEVTPLMFNQKMKGTFKSDMISVARRNGMVTIPINSLDSLMQELEAGNPVIVFQNLGLSFWPQWHYAVAVGYNMSGPDIYLHTDGEAFAKTDMRYFEHTWDLAKDWGLLVLNPNELSATGNEWAHVQAAVMLEDSGKIEEANIAYQTILSKWPKSLPALVGTGNIAYMNKEYEKSVSYLELAVKYHPESQMAWHNLTIALSKFKPSK